MAIVIFWRDYGCDERALLRLSALAGAIVGASSITTLKSTVFWLRILQLLFAHLPIVHFEKHASCRHEGVFDTITCLSRRLKESMKALLSCELLTL